MSNTKRRKKKLKRSGGNAAVRKARGMSGPPVQLLLDQEERKLLMFSPDMLVNQLRREGPKIEASFDRLCDSDMRQISEMFSRASALVYSGLYVSSRRDEELQVACAELLSNGLNSICAATASLRMGYVLQPGILVRSLLETVSTAFHLVQHPEDLAAYRAHDLKSPSTITSAKKALPPFGQMYGFFSDQFAHVGQLHKSVTPVAKFRVRDEALELNLGFLRMSVWLVYVAAELMFNDCVQEPRYWKPVQEGMSWDPSDQERAWMSSFFGL